MTESQYYPGISVRYLFVILLLQSPTSPRLSLFVLLPSEAPGNHVSIMPRYKGIHDSPSLCAGSSFAGIKIQEFISLMLEGDLQELT